jgi:ABC-type antimicrobial peptide transport system permease subunit
MRPGWLASILSRVRVLFGWVKADREFSEEIEAHVEMITERLVCRGMSRTEAAVAARRQFGNSTLLKQRHREARMFLWVATVRQFIGSVDKDLPLIKIRTQEEQIDATLAPERSFASVTTGFGVLALLLASVGIYGVMAASVSRRINEIGVRMALGARADQVLRMVLSEATVLALAGVCGGLFAAFGLTRFLTSFLYGLKPTDALTFAGSGILLWLVAMVASWSPARRPFRIQPAQALRHE